jgi:chromosome segregation ATPase
MKSRDTAVRAKRFELNDRLRKLEDLEMMRRDFETTIFELDRQVTAEEERTGIRDKAHFAYSTLAQSVAQRRDKLVRSIDDLTIQIDAARVVVDALQDEVRRLEAEDLRESTSVDRSRARPERGAAAG